MGEEKKERAIGIGIGIEKAITFSEYSYVGVASNVWEEGAAEAQGPKAMTFALQITITSFCNYPFLGRCNRRLCNRKSKNDKHS